MEHPISLMAGLAIWLPLGIWIIAMMQWAISGDIDVLTAIAGIAVAIGLGGTALLSKQPYMAPLIFGAVIVTMIVFPIAWRGLNKRELEQIDIDAIEKAYELLAMQPGNASAKFKLARMIYKRGMPGHALVLAEEAIQQMPQSFFPEETRIVKSWRHYRTRPELMNPLACLDCGHANRPGLTHCEACGARFLLLHAQGKWLGKGLARKFIIAWSCLIIALVGIPFAAGSLPPGASIPVIVGLMVLSVLMVAFTFRSDKK